MTKPPALFICSPTVWGPSHVAGSVERSCVRCRATVWASPASIEQAGIWGCETVCIPCAVTGAVSTGAPVEIKLPTEAQIDEMKASGIPHDKIVDLIVLLAKQGWKP